MNPWNTIDLHLFVGLNPWVWLQLESAEPPGPFPFLGGVAPDVVRSLHQVHEIMMSGIETAISDIMAKRTTIDDPQTTRRLEDAYAEVVASAPQPYSNIFNVDESQMEPCSYGIIQKNPSASDTMTYGGLRIFNAAARQAIPFGFERPIGPKVGQFFRLSHGATFHGGNSDRGASQRARSGVPTPPPLYALAGS